MLAMKFLTQSRISDDRLPSVKVGGQEFFVSQENLGEADLTNGNLAAAVAQGPTLIESAGELLKLAPQDSEVTNAETISLALLKDVWATGFARMAIVPPYVGPATNEEHDPTYPGGTFEVSVVTEDKE